MGGALSHGADPARLESIAERLAHLAEATATVGVTGSTLLTVLDGNWSGGDLGGFAQGWSDSARQLESTATLLTTAARSLREQAEQQRSASDGQGGGGAGAGWLARGTTGSPLAGGRSPGIAHEMGAGPTDEPAHDEMPDDNDARDDDLDDRPPAFFDDRSDPGKDDVTLPKGADPDHPAIKELMKTEQGRETLDWMARNDITIVYDEDKKGASYSPSGNVMTIGPDHEGATTIIHEASHARWDAEDIRPEVTEVNRDEYIDRQLDNEVEAQMQEIEFMKERREQNWFAYRFHEYPCWTAYNDAYDAAVDGGMSPAQADDAGRAAIKQLYLDGEIVTGSTEQPYTVYYRNQWDDNHRG